MPGGQRGRGPADARLTHLPSDRESGCSSSGGQGGISTVTYTNARDIAASAGNPRQVFLNYPLGNPAGRPHDPENQRNVLRAGLKLLEEADRLGVIVDLPYAWSESRAWMEKFMTTEQPFISEDAEAQPAGTAAEGTGAEGRTIAVGPGRNGEETIWENGKSPCIRNPSEAPAPHCQSIWPAKG